LSLQVNGVPSSWGNGLARETTPHNCSPTYVETTLGCCEVTKALPTGLRLQLTLTLEAGLNWDKCIRSTLWFSPFASSPSSWNHSCTTRTACK